MCNPDSFSRVTNYALTAEMYDECRIIATQNQHYRDVEDCARLIITNAIREAQGHWLVEEIHDRLFALRAERTMFYG